MEVSAKSSITFSINGILSTKRKKERENSTSPTNHNDTNYTSTQAPFYKHVVQSPPRCFTDYSYNTTLSKQRNYAYTEREYISSNNYATKTVYSDISGTYPIEQYSPPERHDVYATVMNSKSPDSVSSSESSGKRNSPTGRFRPPPFFATVLTLRKRLYQLSGKVFPTEEPPTDRNVHKLWRAVEKHKVNYSLQHYFYVASLSTRCFDLVERINQKVILGLLEGSREKEVNQSYFNFLYGKTEDERYKLLLLLEKGQISPKEFIKQKQNSNTAKSNEVAQASCHDCQTTVRKLQKEKQEAEDKYIELKRKYDQMISGTITTNDERKSKRKFLDDCT